MTEDSAPRFPWKAAFLLTIAVGVGFGILIVLAEILFGYSVHPGIGGIAAGLIIGIALSRLNARNQS